MSTCRLHNLLCRRNNNLHTVLLTSSAQREGGERRVLVVVFLGFLGHWLLLAVATGPFGRFHFGLGTTLYFSVLNLNDLMDKYRSGFKAWVREEGED